MPKTFPRRVSSLLILASLLATTAGAQSFNGAIAGKVLDSAGAVVAGAELVLKNVAAGVEMKRTSTDTGEYAFRNLLPGTYELRATSAGFSPFLQRHIEVTMNADVRLDVTLPVGGRTEEVEVVGQPVLNYDTGAHVEGIAPRPASRS
jgi:carboxypeptidase family protein